MKERPASSNQVEAVFDSDGVQVSSAIDEFGREHPDPVPTAPPVGYVPPSDLMQMIERVIHNREFMKALQESGEETFEEADDFEVEEDYDPRFEPTIYEKYFEAKATRAAVNASQKATSRTAGAGAEQGGAAPPPPVSATSEAPKPSTATPKLPSVSRLADERRETE